MRSEICGLLNELDITPVLMDVGASGAPLPIWNDIAPNSVYVGFDPDRREIHEDRASGFRRSVIVNEAVMADGAGEVGFYLTKSPFCSTTLPPNPEAAGHWLESDRFEVERHTTVRATTIDAVLERLGLTGIDWIKLDTQGIDLRLINSISPSTRSRILAVDTEPGLIDIYQGEDLFVDVHRDLTRQGFWLSRAVEGGFVRMRRSTLAAVFRGHPGTGEDDIRRWVRTSPAYFECRYLRTLEWLAAHSLGEREYQLLWIVALTDDQLGFALDVCVEYEKRFGETAASGRLRTATDLLLQHASRRDTVYRAYAPFARSVASIVQKLIG